jgi:hypothetical protein
MIFKKGYYKHTECKDIFIEILNPQYQDTKRFKGRVRYWNLGFTGNPWVLLINEPVEIQAKDFNNWSLFSEDAILELSKNRGTNG